MAIDINNLGQILLAKGDLEGAQKQIERALRINEKVYGLDHPQVAINTNNLGQILKAKGDLDGAQKQIERALAILKNTLDTIRRRESRMTISNRFSARKLQ